MLQFSSCRGANDDGFRFIWIKAKAIEQEPASDCTGVSAGCHVVGTELFVVERNVQLSVVCIPVVINTE